MPPMGMTHLGGANLPAGSGTLGRQTCCLLWRACAQKGRWRVIREPRSQGVWKIRSHVFPFLLDMQ